MIKHLFLIWGLLAALTAEPVLACTSAVVSGKVTPDGRPLLWKNRDTDYLRNHVAYIKGEKYNFIADVNSANFPALKEAWMGTNSVGFALMNTQPYNLVEVKDGEERGGSQREDYLPCLGGLCHGGGFLPFPRYHFQAQLDRGQFWRNRRSRRCRHV